MKLLGFFHTEKQKKNFFEQPNNQKPQNPKTPKPRKALIWRYAYHLLIINLTDRYDQDKA